MLCAALTAIALSLAPLPRAHAIDLLFKFLQKETVNSSVWELNEQYVRLVEIEPDALPNDHPVRIDKTELQQALASLQLWREGGVFRDEESLPVYPPGQAELIARYVSDALSKADAREDVIFNVRSYSSVLLSMAKEREWTTGRVFYEDGGLNLIIGEYQKRLDKGKKMVEGSFGIVDDFRDIYFDPGTRTRKGKMPGRIVTTSGVKLAREGDDRPDWVVLDIEAAALAYRESQTPLEIRKEERRAKAEAAKLTVERRQMREQMARMRKELRDLSAGGGTRETASLEDRLGRLLELHEKGLISEDELKRRKEEILQEI